MSWNKNIGKAIPYQESNYNLLMMLVRSDYMWILSLSKSTKTLSSVRPCKTHGLRGSLDQILVISTPLQNTSSEVTVPGVVKYHKCSNIRRALVGNKIVDHSDVVGASPVGAAPATSSFTTSHLASMDWAKTTARRDEKHLCLGIGCVLY